jgi:hypothetical protein
MATADSCVELMKGTLVLPVPVYPSNIVTDESLKIAANQVQTTLTTRVSSLDSIFRVSDTSRLVVDMLLTIDNEIVSISAIDPAAHSITVVRGFDGTVATSHNAGRLLQAFIDAWHHNSLAAEVKAIEAALGPNLSNLTGSTAIVSRNYAWVAQPGGSLVVGNNQITLTPVPRGVNGSNQHHYVWVTGGTGAAEACLITGGTAVSGNPTGTLIINCANTHSGPWSVGTATAGIQEAVHVAGNSGQPVHIPEGDNQVYATTWIQYQHVALRGNGMDLSRVVWSWAGGDGEHLFRFEGLTTGGDDRQWSNTISDLGLYGQPSRTSGWAIIVTKQVYFSAARLSVVNWSSGILFDNANYSQMADVYINDLEPATGTGVMIAGLDSFATRLDRVIVNGLAAGGNCMAGLRIIQSQDVIVEDCHFIQCQYGLLVDPGTGKSVASIKSIGSYYDNSSGEGARVMPTTGGVVLRCDFSGCWFADAKGGAGLTLSTEGGGIVDGIAVSFSQFYRNAASGLYVAGATNVRVYDSVFSNNSLSAPGVNPGAIFNSGFWMFIGNRSGATDGFGNTQSYGLQAYAGSGTFTVIGNDFTANMSGGMSNGGTGVQIVRDNLGISNVVPSLASAATVTQSEPTETLKITGTVTIFTILPVWNGRTITLIFTDAAPGQLGMGGNIARQQTPVKDQSIRLVFDPGAGKWF